jgi:exo-beta-1,3-glucanase (GH17 family)
VSGTFVTLTATPLGAATFTGWSGEGCSGTGTCTVAMTQARNVIASFTATVSACTPTGALPGALVTCRNWITFAPPRPFNPNLGTFPSEAELRTALKLLYDEGWRGLVTYSLDGTLAAVPRLAKETGFTMVIAGLFWFDDAQLARERAAALDQLTWIDGFVLGNEGLQFGRYTRQRLASELAQLRADTGRPVATSETFGQYQSDPSLSAIGDWVFPNLQFWFDPTIRSIPQAVSTVQSQYQTLQAAAPARTVVVKEAWWPTAGDPAATEANQAEFFRLLAASPVKFVFGEAYDQFWKAEALGQGPHWGLHTDTGSPKQIINDLRDLYTGPY